MENTVNTVPEDADLVRLRHLANFLDNQFVIPIINVRFGLDAVIGLIPWVGDIVGLLISFYLIWLMFKRGASPLLMLRMIVNILLDSLVGFIPFVGDLFDLGFKANSLNLHLLEKYYSENKKRPNAVVSLLVLLGLFMAVLGLIGWLLIRSVYSFYSSF